MSMKPSEVVAALNRGTAVSRLQLRKSGGPKTPRRHLGHIFDDR
jgi:hypothetical protein